MRFRTTWLLLLAVLLLGAAILLVERRGESTRAREEKARQAFRFHPSAVTYLRLESSNLVAECVRDGDRWMLIRPVRARAESGAIEHILYGLRDLSRGEGITPAQVKDRGLSAADFGLQPPRYRITLGDQLRRQTVLVGRDTPLGGQVYIQEEAQSDLAVADGRLLAFLPPSAEALRDAAVFEGRPEEVQRIEVRRGDGLVQVARATRAAPWMIQQPLVGRAAPHRVQQVLEALYRLRAERFVDVGMADLAAYGLHEPRLRVSLARDGGRGESTLLVGDPVDREGGLLYALVRPEETLCVLPAGRLEVLNLGLDDIRDRRLVTLEPSDIRRIAIQGGDRSLVLSRADGAWQMIEPRTWRVEQAPVRHLLAAWTGEAVLSFLPPVTNPAAAGLASPEWILRFSGKPAEPPDPGARAEPGVVADEVAIHIAAASAEPGRRRVLVSPEQAAFEIGTDLVALLSLDPVAYRDRQVLAVEPDDVVRLAMRRDGTEQVLERDGTGAFLTRSPGAGPVNRSAVNDLLAEIGDLRVERFVPTAEGNPAEHGLDPPGATLTVGLRGTTALAKVLHLGRPTERGARAAMLQGQDMLFSLAPQTCERLLRPWYDAPEPPDQPPAPHAP